MWITIGMWSARPRIHHFDILKTCCSRLHVSSQNLSVTQNTNSSAPAPDSKPVPQVLKDTLSSFRETTTKNVYRFMATYEEFIGIKQVREAHGRVLDAEDKFVQLQERRRNAHSELVDLQHRLRELRAVIDRTPRGNEKYLELITREINLTREEKEFREKFENEEKQEREAFHHLSSALRFSHEKERAQNEKTKYWSVFGSLVGACVGIVGANISSYLKIRQIKRVVTENSEESVMEFQSKMMSVLDALLARSKGAGSSDFPAQSNPETDPKLLKAVSTISKQMEGFNKRLNEIEVSNGTPDHHGSSLIESIKNDRGLAYLIVNSAMVGALVVAIIISKFYSPGT